MAIDIAQPIRFIYSGSEAQASAKAKDGAPTAMFKISLQLFSSCSMVFSSSIIFSYRLVKGRPIADVPASGASDLNALLGRYFFLAAASMSPPITVVARVSADLPITLSPSETVSVHDGHSS